jgi:glycosyltransferase involved in cell wall biosynthesis
MYIAICSPGMPFNGETIGKGQSLGGSETAAYYMARELAKLGHKVIIFTTHQQTGEWDGVRYEFIGRVTNETPLGDKFHFIMQAPYDVVICQRHPYSFARLYNSKLNIWWLHDLALLRNTPHIGGTLINMDQVFTVSEWHKKQVAKVYDIDDQFVYATKNGIDYDMPVLREPEYDRIENSLIYTARPERGLVNLLEKNGIMENLPDYHLYIAGYDNVTAHMKSFYEYLWHRAEELPNVTNLGPLGKEDLYRWYKKCKLYVYPTYFEETSCITALETSACGLPFIGTTHGALPETLKDGGAVLLNFKSHSHQSNLKKFAKTVRYILDNKEKWEKLHNKTANIYQPWDRIAKEWVAQFKELFKKRSESKYNLYKHFEKNSDIVAITKAGGTADNWPSLYNNYGFFLSGKYKEHYKKYYEYEANRGVNYGPEDLSGNARFETTLNIIEQIQPLRILDYGCAHGHYVMNLAKRLPNGIEFVGIDLDDTNIDKAVSWARDENLSDRCKFFSFDGTISKFKSILGQDDKFNKFDVILLGEILEHVESIGWLMNVLNGYLSENGYCVITTPYGPWEAIGYFQHKGWRAHIHHFEREDLNDMFSNQRNYKLLALPFKGDLGHLITTFQLSGKPFGEINYERKIAHQAPNQTLSVCMIAKDEEDAIKKTLKSIEEIADEIIIGLDRTTTDRTREIAEEFGAKIVDIDSPIEIGFDMARNATIEAAKMNWILWIDADETLQYPKAILPYLRPNCFNGYCIKQHHFATEPPSLFKTDLPVRLFRNHLGIKFYGHVHEHPEIKYNKGIGKTIIIDPTAIMHTGYATEEIRRKRFQRNWPLMQKDRKRFPDRILGHFLWARDLIHINRYTLERNGGIINADIKNNCVEVINTWRKLLKTKHMRMILDGLTYYSEAVRTLGNGINHAYYCVACSLNEQIPNDLPAIRGTFANTDDIKALNELVQKDCLSQYDEKYY